MPDVDIVYEPSGGGREVIGRAGADDDLTLKLLFCLAEHEVSAGDTIRLETEDAAEQEAQDAAAVWGVPPAVRS